MMNRLATACVLTACFALGADELQLKGVQPDANGIYTFDFTSNPTRIEVHDCGPVFEVKPGDFVSVSWEARVISDTNAHSDFCKIRAGFRMFDADRRPISSNKVHYVDGTLNELVNPAKKGDRSLAVRKPWKEKKNSYAALFVKDDKSDIPNRNLLSLAGNGAATAKNGSFELMLAKPLPLDLPAGTKIRQHFWGTEFPFQAWPNAGAWKSYSFSVGKYASGSPKPDEWWPGTKYAQLQFWLTSYRQFKLKLQIRDIKIKVMKTGSGDLF